MSTVKETAVLPSSVGAGVPESRPLVSVITPTKNRPAFIARTVELFLAQTYRRTELLIVDDGHPGTVPDVSAWPNIRVIRAPGWPQKKRSTAYPHAQGEILCHWDDDDWFAPNRITRQVEALERGAAACGFPTEHVLALLEGKWFRWKGGSSIPFHDGTLCLWRRKLDELSAAERESQVSIIKALIARGEKVVALPNEGAFVYVRHGANASTVDLGNLKLAAPCAAPGFWRRVMETVDRTAGPPSSGAAGAPRSRRGGP